MNKIKIITNGILKENPVLVLLLGMCPTLATTTSAINGLSMGLATMSVLICTNFVISCIKSITPDKVRIPVFIVVIAAFVTILQMLMAAYAPDSINKALGIYIPLIVVNCLSLAVPRASRQRTIPWQVLPTAWAWDLDLHSGLPCSVLYARYWARAASSASCFCRK